MPATPTVDAEELRAESEAHSLRALLELKGYRARLPEILGLALLYYVTARLGQTFAIDPGNVTPVWIPSGICLAAILIRGPVLWPGIFLGAFAGNIWAYVDWSSVSGVALSLLTASANGLGDVLCAVGAAALIRRRTGTSYPFERSAHGFRFFAFGVFFGPLVSALLGILSLCAAGFMPWSQWQQGMLTWWTGDAVGVLVITPWLLALVHPLATAHGRRGLEPSLALLGFSLIAATVLGLIPTPVGLFLPIFTLAPFLILCAFILNQRLLFAAILITAAFAIIALQRGVGPWTQLSVAKSYLVMQWFLAVMAITIITLSSTIHERRNVQEQLTRAHQELEKRVALRTRQLQASYDSLRTALSQRIDAEKSREKMEAQLRHAQKQEALGTLAGGIAHDFNNILMAVMGFQEMALQDAPEGGKIEANLRLAHQSLLRARNLVRGILLFANQGGGESSPLQLRALVSEVIAVLRASLPSTIEIHTVLSADPVIEADSSQIYQVLMNLCTNSFRAMPDGGRLEIQLDELTLEEELRGHTLQAAAGRYARLRVSDSGPGIEPSILDSIFDPFFTTNQESGGTGLGLAVVHGVVQAAGGTITVESAAGEGTSFTVYLPASDRILETTRPAEPPIRKGQESILFIDDEEMLVELSKTLLGQLGYRVTGFTDSVEALEQFRAHPAQFDIVITDLTMPRLGGHEVARAIKELRSDIPILLCSGFSDRMESDELEPLEIAATLAKPLTRSEIVAAIRRALDGDGLNGAPGDADSDVESRRAGKRPDSSATLPGF